MEKVSFAIDGWAHLWCRNNVRHSICLLTFSAYLCTQNTVWENYQQNCHAILFTLRQNLEFSDIPFSICVYECLCVQLSHHHLPAPAGNELVFLGHRAAFRPLFCGFSQFLPFSDGMHCWETLTRKLYEIHMFFSSYADVSIKWLLILLIS